jgi:hypothetical protein
MADKKISALSASTTPLTGTEVLPIVQGGATVKVAVSDLTAGRAVNSAGGTFTDNLTQGTASKGVNFTANTPQAGMTSQLLNWYEEGTWTPVIGCQTGTITAYASQARYTRNGRQIFIQGKVTLTTVGTAAGVMTVGSLPFQTSGMYTPTGLVTETATTGTTYSMYLNINNTTGVIQGLTGAGGPAWVNGYVYQFNIVYTV